MLLNAIRVGAALYAVSIAAGASVLMPYLSLIWSIVASRRVRLCSSSRPSKSVERVQPVGDKVVQLHADEVRMVVLLARRARLPQPAQRGNQRLVVLALAAA